MAGTSRFCSAGEISTSRALPFGIFGKSGPERPLQAEGLPGSAKLTAYSLVRAARLAEVENVLAIGETVFQPCLFPTHLPSQRRFDGS